MSFRLTKTKITPAPENLNPDRPPIWAEGQKRSGFNVLAFARASHRRSVALTSSLLDRLAALAGKSHTAWFLIQARRTLNGDTGPDATEMTARLAASFGQAQVVPARPAPARPSPARPSPARPAAADDPLAGLRDAFRAEAKQTARARRNVLPEVALNATQEPSYTAIAVIHIVAALGLLLLLPVGSASALLAYLAGEDLRTAA